MIYMMNSLIWLIIAFGWTTIVVYGSIFEKVRVFFKKYIPFIGELISCPMCTSTWVGFIMSYIFNHLCDDYLVLNPTLVPYSTYIFIFIDGVFTSGGVWFINSVSEWFEENRINFKS